MLDGGEVASLFVQWLIGFTVIVLILGATLGVGGYMFLTWLF